MIDNSKQMRSRVSTRSSRSIMRQVTREPNLAIDSFSIGWPALNSSFGFGIFHHG
jgi:hypothetical protein